MITGLKIVSARTAAVERNIPVAKKDTNFTEIKVKIMKVLPESKNSRPFKSTLIP